MNKSEMASIVISAFADVSYPGDDYVAAPNGRDDADIVNAIFIGRNWDSLTPKELWPAALSFMTPQAFQYYLPAYLLSWDYGEVGDAVFHHITPYGGEEEFFESNFKLFSKAQKQAIYAFILFTEAEVTSWYRDRNDEISKGKVEKSFRQLREFWSVYRDE